MEVDACGQDVRVLVVSSECDALSSSAPPPSCTQYVCVKPENAVAAWQAALASSTPTVSSSPYEIVVCDFSILASENEFTKLIDAQYQRHRAACGTLFFAFPALIVLAEPEVDWVALGRFLNSTDCNAITYLPRGDISPLLLNPVISKAAATIMSRKGRDGNHNDATSADAAAIADDYGDTAYKNLQDGFEEDLPDTVAEFTDLVSFLGESLNVSHVLIGEVMPDVDAVQTLAFYCNGKIVRDFTYMLEGTPCQNVVRANDVCYYPEGVAEMFKGDEMLAEASIESYLGTPISLPDGTVIGILILMDGKALRVESPLHLTEVLRQIANRAAQILEMSQNDGVEERPSLVVREEASQVCASGTCLGAGVSSPDASMST